MSVKVNIKGNKETNEYQDAVELKQMFEEEFRGKYVDGQILIISNATLFGQEVKDIDLIVLGNFDKFSCRIKTTAIGPEKESLPLEERTVFVNNFCFCIETKRQTAESVRLEGTTLSVRYNNKLSDATTQSENQKYSLKRFFEDRLKTSPYVANFIWLKSVSWESIKSLLNKNEKLYTKHNFLPTAFSFNFLVQLACIQLIPYQHRGATGEYKGYCSYSSLRYREQYDLSLMEKIFDLFTTVRDGIGDMTRKKIEYITKKLLDNQQYAQMIGEKLIVISGRVGTGKTIKLLRIACDLAINKGARSLILTYNHSLVSDLKRMLALAEIPDGVDEYAVHICTLHKFIYELVLGFNLGINQNTKTTGRQYIPDFLKSYPKYLEELNGYIDAGLIEEKDIQDMMAKHFDKVSWNYVLVDEAQDWDINERNLIFKIFEKNKTIVADGVDQLIRSNKKCNWVQGLKPDLDFKKTNEKRGLRQEVQLVTFVNAYVKQVGLSWELEPKQELIGGKIIITTAEYSKKLHDSLLKDCKDKGNSEYEMMFLVPPTLVNRFKESDSYGTSKEKRSFALTAEFENMGIKIWDGTDTDLRTQYTVQLNEHRLFQYESGRGLEGWTVVCFQLDEFIRYKTDTFVDVEDNSTLALESFEEKRRKFVLLWSLIPLTRAIDTLVITLKNKDSETGNHLKSIYKANPDIIQWIDN